MNKQDIGIQNIQLGVQDLIKHHLKETNGSCEALVIDISDALTSSLMNLGSEVKLEVLANLTQMWIIEQFPKGQKLERVQ